MFDQSVSGSGRRTEKALHFMKKGKTYDVDERGTDHSDSSLSDMRFQLFFGPCCRFTPSCSSYALLSIRRFGIIEGVLLIFKRLAKCHPFHPGGYDPVPEIIKKS